MPQVRNGTQEDHTWRTARSTSPRSWAWFGLPAFQLSEDPVDNAKHRVPHKEYQPAISQDVASLEKSNPDPPVE